VVGDDVVGGSAIPATGSSPATRLPEAFVAAMDDDLGTPAAVAVIHDTVREGNRLLADGASDALRGNAASVRAMLGVLGLDPADPGWGDGGGAEADRLRQAVDALITGLLEERAQARADKDWGRADAIRDRIKAAGIELEDTPTGPKWSL
jgi:cysteinyl-tRNA synthetase